jgi:hypothetical protein
MRRIGTAKWGSYDISSHGQFYWNFRTELEDRWDFQQVMSRGWLPSPDEWTQNYVHLQEEIDSICVQQKSPSSDTREGGSGFVAILALLVLVLLIGCVMQYVRGTCWRPQMGGYSSIDSSAPRNNDQYSASTEMKG